MEKKKASFCGSIIILVITLILAACSPGTPTPNSGAATEIAAAQPPATGTLSAASPGELVHLPVVDSPSLVGFEMLNSMYGWGVTDSKLVRTTDGGVTWMDITPTSVTSLGFSANVYFLDQSTGWLVIPALDYINGTIFQTRDGGNNWASSPVPFSGGQFDFINAYTGFILVGRGAAAGSSAVDVYTTSDGGTNWTPVYIMQPGASEGVNTLPFGGQKSGIAFLDDEHGWVGGNIPMDGYVYLFSSKDGGHIWAKQAIDLPGGYETFMSEVGIVKFFNKMDGILPIRLLKDIASFDFYTSHDAGVTWSSTTPLITNGQYSIPSMEDIIAWDGGQNLHVSQDGGISWNTIRTNVNVIDILMKFDFVDTLTGWMLTGDATNHHMLYKTVDGGATWNVLIP